MTSLRFGRFEVQPVQRQVRVDGEAAALGARAFDVLLALVENRDRVVTKGELLDRVWAGLVVEEGNLQMQVSTLRKLLGAKAIATIPGRGYRFAAEVEAGDADSAVPVLAANDDSPACVPAVPATLFGRGDDLLALRGALEKHRCVSLVGPAGIGKTTLAAAAAQEDRGRHRDGIVWVDLAPIAEPSLLASAVARSLGIAAAGIDPTRALVKALARSQQVLVLDNAEHLVGAVAHLAQALLDGAPGLRLVVTSQARLKIDAERVFRVEPLDAPTEPVDARQALSFGAVALFVDQARASDRSFVLSDADAPAVARICKRLDGVALAIKLAAARLRLLGLQQLEARLADRFKLLADGPRNAPSRQQTLLAALDWSHAQLGTTEQAVFRRLGVFTGSFELEHAAVLAGDAELDEWAVIEALGTLVDRSLVVVQPGAAHRYRLLESAREHARRQLAQAGESAAHHSFAVRTVRERFPDLAAREPEMLARWLTEAGSFEAAADEWERAAGLAQRASLFVVAEHHLTKAVEALDQTAASIDIERRKLGLLIRLGALAGLTHGLGSAPCERIYLRALGLCERAGTISDDFVASFNLWFNAAARSEPALAADYMERALRLAEASGDERFIVQACHATYTTCLLDGRFERASQAAQEGYRCYRPVDGPFHQQTFAGHDPGICAAGHGAICDWALGRYDRCEQGLERLRGLMQTVNHVPSRVIGGSLLAGTAIWARRIDEARSACAEIVALCQRYELPQWEGYFTVWFNWVAAVADGDASACDRMIVGLEKVVSLGTRWRVPLSRMLIAEALLACGRIAEARTSVERTLADGQAQGERTVLPFALIIRAGVEAAEGSRADSQASLRSAIEIAELQLNRSIALRASIRLARSMADAGLHGEARALVEPRLAPFDPAWRSADLDEARALLSRLSTAQG